MSQLLAGYQYRFEAGKHPHRTLLLLHGTGGDEHDLIPLGRQLDPDANLLNPRGNVVEGTMPRFFRRIAEGVFDEADLIMRAGQLAAFLAAAAATHGFAAATVTAVGYSNGANIAAGLLLLHPDTLAQALLFRAMVPLTPSTTPDLRGHRVALSAGRNDPLVPATHVERLGQILREAHADVTTWWWPASHGLVPGELHAAQEWLRQE